MLGIAERHVPVTAADLVVALKAQARGGGFGRSDPRAYTPGPDPTTDDDRIVWNPRPGNDSRWTDVVGGLTVDVATEFADGTR